MDVWTKIQNPNTGENLSIFSNAGRELLKGYLRLVKTRQAGGDYSFDLSESVAGQAVVTSYDSCNVEEAAQAGGDYRFDLSAEPVAGLPPVASYDGCEEAAAAQVGGDYFLDPAMEPVGGLAEVVGTVQVPNSPPHPTPMDANNNA